MAKIQQLASTKSGNFSHLTNDGVKTLCGREVSGKIENSYYVSCHRCTKGMSSRTREWIDSNY